MDWAKAKTILIVIFIFLNVFLLATILYTNSNLRFQSDYTRLAREYLKSKNIQVQGNIPEISGKVGKISYSVKNINLDQLSQIVFGHKSKPQSEEGEIFLDEGDENITLTGDELAIRDLLPNGKQLFNNPASLAEKIDSYFAGLGYPKGTLIPQKSQETSDLISMTYMMRYGKAILFDHIVSVQLDKEGIMTVTLTSREPKRRNEPEEILTAYQVLVMGNLPANMKIKSMEFGYKRIYEEDLYDSPVWRLVLDDGTEIFYNAYTGEKLN